MANVSIFTTKGDLKNKVNEVIALASPYAELTYEKRIENVLNYYDAIIGGVTTDYVNLGYLNYGLTNDGRFQIDLDNYRLKFTGTFGYLGSKVSKVEIYNYLDDTTYTIDGALNYIGLPFFSAIKANSKISSLSSFESSGQYVRVHMDGTYSNGNISGKIIGVGAGYNKLGVVYLEVLEGGNIKLDKKNGVFDVDDSGGFTKGYLAILESNGNVIDSLNSEKINFPVNKKISEINLYDKADVFTLTGILGSTIYCGNGDDKVIGSAYQDNIYGEAGSDTLNAGAGNDILDGGAGADVLIGGAGDDVYVVDNAKDKVSEAPSGGTDEVRASVTWTLGANFEKLTLTGAAAINAAGNQLDNVITGNAGKNILNGGVGNDILTGGDGADIFKFDTALNASTNLDTITDFLSGTDKISLSKSKFASVKAGVKADNLVAGGTDQVLQANDYLRFDSNDHRLYYDADGNGAKFQAVAVVELTGVNSLQATDFIIV